MVDHGGRRAAESTCGPLTRRALLAAATFSASPAAAAARWRLFLTARHVAFQRGIRFVPRRPALSDENLLPAEYPWEAARANAYSTLIDGPTLRLWYSAHALLQDTPRFGPGARIFTGDSMCYAESEDGLHFRKPRLDLIPFQGSRQNNIVLPGSGPCIFVDPFDRPERRFKMLAKNLEGSKPEFVERWPEARGADPRASYLLTSPDGFRWRRNPDPIIPFSLGSQRHILWDDRIGRWVVFMRANRPANLCYSRVEIEKDAWDQPIPFRRKAGKAYMDAGSRPPLLEDEWPIAVDVDDRDRPHANIYSMNPWKVPDCEDAYLAFVPVWYKQPGSDQVEVQLAVSDDGVTWTRPWREPLIAPGAAGPQSAGQIWPVPDPIIRGEETWLYVQALPYRHLDFRAPQPGQGITARAVFGRNRFVGVEAVERDAELVTHPMKVGGRFLELNTDARAGRLRVSLETAEGNPLKGYSLEESIPISADAQTAAARWRGRSDLSGLVGSVVRLRFTFEHCRFYAFRFSS